MVEIAVIGSGLSGLTVGHKLSKYANITIFEKSRGVGGRVATRRVSPFSFNHGAQFFRVNSQLFENFIAPMVKDGIIDVWQGDFVEFDSSKITAKRKWNADDPHYVGVPNMNAIAKHLALNLTIKLNTRVSKMLKNDKWVLIDDMGNELGDFDWVIITAPAPQALDLLPNYFAHYDQVASVKMSACFSLMLGFQDNINLGFDAALVRNANISWVSVNSTKPNQSSDQPLTSILVHSTNKWADNNIDNNLIEVQDYLCEETSRVVGCNMNIAEHKSLHAWRYANISKQNSPHSFIDTKNQIATCGDWHIQGRIESAFLSAVDAANNISKMISCG